MASRQRTVRERELRTFAQQLFVAAGVPEEHAILIANVLVWSNLRGVDHGVLRIPGYLARLEGGLTNATPKIRVTSDLPAAAVLHTDAAFGQVALARATEIAIQRLTLPASDFAL